MPMTSETRKVLVSGKAGQRGLIDERTRRSLHYSNVEGMASSASSSLFDSYIIPFLLSIGGTAGHVGLLTAAKNLTYTIAQIPGAKMTEFYSRKGIWMISRILSRVVFLVPLLLIALVPSSEDVYPVIALTGLIVFSMGLATPAWSSLIGDLVPTEIRGRYFGRRNMLLGAAGIIVTIAGGYIISSYGFFPIFLAFGIFGLVAIPLLLKMYEKPFAKQFHYRHSFSFRPADWPRAIRTNNALSAFTLYITLINFATILASPFYTVYMLNDMNLGYGVFAAIITLGALARMLSFKYWGRMNDRFGSRTILVITGILAILTPFLMIFTTDAVEVALVFIIDGFIWAGFDLVTFNYLLDIIPAEKRPQYVANHSFFVGLGVFFGALTGGLLATVFEGQTFLLLSGLKIVFLTSFVLRLFILPLLFKIPSVDVKQTEVVPVRYIFWNTVAVEPAREIMQFMTYTFRYPYEIEKEFKDKINRARYKIRMKVRG